MKNQSQSPHPKFVFLTFGMGTFGKSYFLVNRVMPKLKRKVFIDSQKSLEPPTRISEYHKTRRLFTRDFESTFYALKTNFNSDFFEIVCQFPDDEEPYLFELVWNLGNIDLIVDEIDYFAKPVSCDDNLSKMATKGRHKNIRLFGATQRPTMVHPDLRSQANVLMTFRQEEAIDLKYFYSINPEKGKKLSRLDTGEYLVFRGESQLNGFLSK